MFGNRSPFYRLHEIRYSSRRCSVIVSIDVVRGIICRKASQRSIEWSLETPIVSKTVTFAKQAIMIYLLDSGYVVSPRLDGFTWLCGPYVEGRDEVMLRH